MACKTKYYTIDATRSQYHYERQLCEFSLGEWAEMNNISKQQIKDVFCRPGGIRLGDAIEIAKMMNRTIAEEWAGFCGRRERLKPDRIFDVEHARYNDVPVLQFVNDTKVVRAYNKAHQEVDGVPWWLLELLASTYGRTGYYLRKKDDRTYEWTTHEYMVRAKLICEPSNMAPKRPYVVRVSAWNHTGALSIDKIMIA